MCPIALKKITGLHTICLLTVQFNKILQTAGGFVGIDDRNVDTGKIGSNSFPFDRLTS